MPAPIVAAVGQAASAAAKVAITVAQTAVKAGAQIAATVGKTAVQTATTVASKVASVAKTGLQTAGNAVKSVGGAFKGLAGKIGNVAQAGPQAPTAGVPTPGPATSLSQTAAQNVPSTSPGTEAPAQDQSLAGKIKDRLKSKGDEGKQQGGGGYMAAMQESLKGVEGAHDAALEGEVINPINPASISGAALSVGAQAFSAVKGGFNKLRGAANDNAAPPLKDSVRDPRYQAPAKTQERGMAMAA